MRFIKVLGPTPASTSCRAESRPSAATASRSCHPAGKAILSLYPLLASIFEKR